MHLIKNYRKIRQIKLFGIYCCLSVFRDVHLYIMPTRVFVNFKVLWPTTYDRECVLGRYVRYKSMNRFLYTHDEPRRGETKLADQSVNKAGNK